jgi:hypothetical protein
MAKQLRMPENLREAWFPDRDVAKTRPTLREIHVGVERGETLPFWVTARFSYKGRHPHVAGWGAAPDDMWEGLVADAEYRLGLLDEADGTPEGVGR